MPEAYTEAVSQGHPYEFPFHVGFGHCDPAGIVYFPRFFDVFHQAMESWFGSLGFPYAELITGRKIGFPAVHSEADFRAPCAFGERLTVRMSVAKLGRSSLHLSYEIWADEEAAPRLRGTTICVVMDLDPLRESYRSSMPLPDDLRAAIAPLAP